MCAYKKTHPQVVLARMNVGDVIVLLEGNGLEVYKGIDWRDGELMRYIERVLEGYSKKYKRNAEKH